MSTSFASQADNIEQTPRVVELADRVFGYISDHDPNCGFVVGDDHVIAIDTRPTPRLARAFLRDIATVTDKPVRFIVLTHYHAVRVLGASAFPDVQAIVASRGTADWIRARGQADFDSEAGRFPRLFAGIEEIPGLTHPTVVFDRHLSIHLDGRELRLINLGRGHSMGDTVCWIPDTHTLFAGDVVENHCGVYAGDAYVRDWLGTLDAVAALRPRVMVPGRGAVLRGAADCQEAVASTQSFLRTLVDTVQAAIDAGESLKQAYERAQAVMVPRFGQWPVFDHVLPFDVSRVYDELNGIEHPRIWTAERDQDLWQLLRG